MNIRGEKMSDNTSSKSTLLRQLLDGGDLIPSVYDLPPDYRVRLIDPNNGYLLMLAGNRKGEFRILSYRQNEKGEFVTVEPDPAELVASGPALLLKVSEVFKVVKDIAQREKPEYVTDGPLPPGELENFGPPARILKLPGGLITFADPKWK